MPGAIDGDCDFMQAVDCTAMIELGWHWGPAAASEACVSFAKAVMFVKRKHKLENLTGQGLSLTDGTWIKVSEYLPLPRIRVWASSGELDVGHDCFVDTQGRWRYTHSEVLIGADDVEKGCIPHPITHWMPLPCSPNHVPTDFMNLPEPYPKIEMKRVDVTKAIETPSEVL